MMDEVGDMLQETVRLGEKVGDGSDLAGGVGKAVKEGSISREKLLPKEAYYERARNQLIDELDRTGAFENGSNPYTGRLKSSYGYGKQIGRESLNGKVRWRLDYDPEIGVHYNIEDFTNGKGVNAKKTVIPIDISYDEYKAIIDLWN